MPCVCWVKSYQSKKKLLGFWWFESYAEECVVRGSSSSVLKCIYCKSALHVTLAKRRIVSLDFRVCIHFHLFMSIHLFSPLQLGKEMYLCICHWQKSHDKMPDYNNKTSNPRLKGGVATTELSACGSRFEPPKSYQFRFLGRPRHFVKLTYCLLA